MLIDAFTEAIRKSYTPCPLIGPKWFQFFPEESPARFRFAGTRKLAKATTRPPERVLARLLGNLNLGELDVEIRTTTDLMVDVLVKQPPGPES